MILFTPVPAVATPKTALAAIATATGPSDASRATTGAGRASATAIATATGPSDASRATTGAGRASATAIATATTAITRTKPPLQAHTLAPLAHSEQYTTKRTHGRREALGAAAAELTSHLY
jgi:hypothetical protein